jgi:hypothetical protein
VCVCSASEILLSSEFKFDFNFLGFVINGTIFLFYFRDIIYRFRYDRESACIDT